LQWWGGAELTADYLFPLMDTNQFRDEFAEIQDRMNRYLDRKVMESLAIPNTLYSGESTSCASSMGRPSPDSVYGYSNMRPKFISSPYMADFVQYRFPRSKKKRIRKKWAKDLRNYRYVPWKTVYLMGDTVFAHPAVIGQIEREMAGK
jgi:hypothetical protein